MRKGWGVIATRLPISSPCDVCHAVFGFEAVQAALPFKYAYRFEDVADGTGVTFRAEVSTLGGRFGKLAEPVVIRMYSHGVKANLANLKALLEA